MRKKERDDIPIQIVKYHMIFVPAIIVAVSLIICLSGCTTTVEASTETSSFNMEYVESDLINWTGSFYLYYDEETGVEYIAFESNGGCSITPRLNADGSLYIHNS